MTWRCTGCDDRFDDPDEALAHAEGQCRAFIEEVAAATEQPEPYLWRHRERYEDGEAIDMLLLPEEGTSLPQHAALADVAAESETTIVTWGVDHAE